MRIVATLEIPLRDEEGTYLVVTHPDYGTGDLIERSNGATPPAEAGEWTPPYVSYDVPDGNHRPQFSRDTSKLSKRFRETVESNDVTRDVSQFSNRLGLSCTEFAPFDDDICEFRWSFRTPKEFRGYQIKRFLGRVEEDDLPNIADHEMRKGFAFLPIDGRFANLKLRQCGRHRRPERLFMGKPIASNLRTVLEDEGARETLCSQAVDVSSDLLSTKYDGFILAGDLAGYGRFCQFLGDCGGSLNTSGESEAQEFRDLSIRLFTRLFHRADIRHVHTAGDGFICALPASEPDAGQDQFEQALSAYVEMTARLNEINVRAADLARRRGQEAPPRLGSRLAIHHGSYRFGKMSLLASLLPTLDGASVIEAARIEAGLRNWIYGNDRQDRHWVAVSEQATGKLGDLDLANLNKLGPFQVDEDVDVSEKEFSSSVSVWRTQ